MRVRPRVLTFMPDFSLPEMMSLMGAALSTGEVILTDTSPCRRRPARATEIMIIKANETQPAKQGKSSGEKRFRMRNSTLVFYFCALTAMRVLLPVDANIQRSTRLVAHGGEAVVAVEWGMVLCMFQKFSQWRLICTKRKRQGHG